MNVGESWIWGDWDVEVDVYDGGRGDASGEVKGDDDDDDDDDGVKGVDDVIVGVEDVVDVVEIVDDGESGVVVDDGCGRARVRRRRGNERKSRRVRGGVILC